jgi:FKBP-type peptidyl-prolyl cis-trans isomerase FkpA
LYNAAVQYNRLVRLVVALVALAVSAVAINGCGPTPTAPENGAPYSQKDLQLGTGADAVSGKTITANYTGWLYDSSKTDQKGLQFETSVGGTALTFTLGAGQVIAGIDQGVNGMKVGGVRRIVIPSSLGYGATRNGPIPPFSTIVFEVELLDAQ